MITTSSPARGARRLGARIAAAIVAMTAILATVTLSSGPAQAQVHYPWQDPGASRAFTEAAVSQVGRSYCWAGGNAWGPTLGSSDSGCGTYTTGPGFDCSGLIHYSLSQAFGYDVGDSTADGYANTVGYVVSSPAPGDLLFFDTVPNRPGYEHVGIFLGVNRDNNVVEWVEAYGYGSGATAPLYTVKISAYHGAHLIKRVF